jgi:hypothetical protein
MFLNAFASFRLPGKFPRAPERHSESTVTLYAEIHTGQTSLVKHEGEELYRITCALDKKSGSGAN